MAYQIRIDHLLAERRMSLQELADKIGMSPVNLSAYKTGKVKGIRLNTLTALCETLHCEPGDLFVYVPETEEVLEAVPEAEAAVLPALYFNIGQTIKQLREQAGLTVSAFAKEVGLKTKDIEKIEAGDTGVPIQVFQQIAARLGKRVDFGFGLRFV